MGKWIGFVAVASGCFLLYWFEVHKSPAYMAYLLWAKAAREGDCKTLYAMADGDAKRWVDSYCTGSAGMTILGHEMSNPSAASMVSELRNTPQGSMMRFHHELETEDDTSDGAVQLVAVESVLNRPTAHFKPGPPSRQTLKLKEVGENYKVLEYKDEQVPETK